MERRRRLNEDADSGTGGERGGSIVLDEEVVVVDVVFSGALSFIWDVEGEATAIADATVAIVVAGVCEDASGNSSLEDGIAASVISSPLPTKVSA